MSRSCCYCGELEEEEELRPYGLEGADTCFPCAMATPERKAEAQRQFAEKFTAAGPYVALGGADGPVKLTRDEAEAAARASKAGIPRA